MSYHMTNRPRQAPPPPLPLGEAGAGTTMVVIVAAIAGALIFLPHLFKPERVSVSGYRPTARQKRRRERRRKARRGRPITRAVSIARRRQGRAL